MDQFQSLFEGSLCVCVCVVCCEAIHIDRSGHSPILCCHIVGGQSHAPPWMYKKPVHNLINYLSTGQGFCLSATSPSSTGLTTHFGLQVDRCVKTPKPQCMRRCEAASLTSRKKTFPIRGVANTSSCYDS